MLTDGTAGVRADFSDFEDPPPLAGAGAMANTSATAIENASCSKERMPELPGNRIGLVRRGLRAGTTDDHQQDERHDETHLETSAMLPKASMVHDPL